MAYPVGEALEQRVGEHQAQRGGSQDDAVGVQLQQDAQPQQELPAQQACTPVSSTTCVTPAILRQGSYQMCTSLSCRRSVEGMHHERRSDLPRA